MYLKKKHRHDPHLSGAADTVGSAGWVSACNVSLPGLHSMAGSVSVREKEKEMMARGTFSEKVLRI